MTIKRAIALLVLICAFAVPSMAGEIEIPPAPTELPSSGQTSATQPVDDTTGTDLIEILVVAVVTNLLLPSR
jgi:hypothetical protein